MSDQGTSISARPSSSQTSSHTTRNKRFIIGLGLWEIPFGVATASGGSRRLSRELVLLQFGDSIGNVAIVDIHCVDLAETIERLFRFAGIFKRHREIVAQGENSVLLEPGHFKGALVPDGSNLGLAFIHETKSE